MSKELRETVVESLKMGLVIGLGWAFMLTGLWVALN